MIALGLVRVGDGESADRAVEAIAGAEVGGNRDGIARSCVPTGERRPARAGVLGQLVEPSASRSAPNLSCRAAGARSSRAPSIRVQPRKTSLAACVRRCPATTRQPVVAIPAAPGERFEDRCLRLLDLQEQGVARRSLRAAARRHRRFRRCRRRRPCAPNRRLGSAPSARGSRPRASPGSAGRQPCASMLAARSGRCSISGGESADPPLAVDHVRQLVERPEVGRVLGLADHARLAAGAPGALVEQPAYRSATSSRAYQTSRCPMPADCAIRPRYAAAAARAASFARLRREPVRAARHDDARGQPLDVPLERRRQRLIEIVDIEHDPALRRGVDPEVQRGGRPRTPGLAGRWWACPRGPPSINAAAPRKKVNGDSRHPLVPDRERSGIREVSCCSTILTGSRRSEPASQTAWLALGTCARNARAACRRSSRSLTGITSS